MPQFSVRPRPETKTGRVWTLADQISQRKGRRATRSEVMDAFLKHGGNPNTASTQYSHWRADFDRRTALSDDQGRASESRGGRMTLRIGEDGRLWIPTELRQKMMLAADGQVSASVKDGELRLVAPNVALKRLQELVREKDQGEGSVVDELIAERRAERE